MIPRVLARAGLLAWGVALAAGCGPKAPPPVPEVGLTPEQAAARLRTEQARRLRIEAVYRATLPGMMAAMPAVDIEVFAQQPDQLYVAAKGFFEMPMLVVASDGASVTVYDALHPAGPQWKKGPATAQALNRYLPAALSPQDLVHVCLGAVVPFTRVRGFVEDDGAGGYVLTVERADGSTVAVRAAHQTDHIREMVFCGPGAPADAGPVPSASCPIRVQAEDLTAGPDGLAVPHTLRIEVSRGGAVDVVGLRMKRGTVNGEAFPAALFVVPAPAGGTYEPL